MAKNTPPEPCLVDVQLRDSAALLYRLARESLLEIEAVAKAIDLILERPDRKDHFITLGHLVAVIRNQANSATEYLEAEAGSVGIPITTATEMRRMYPGGPDGHLAGVH
jgi:hypothetical protein